jgi:glycosyltransferase involved in cell wall biosynthesis
MSIKKIALVTSGQPALNPRVVKEADTLCESGYQVTVFYAYWNEWGTAIDNEMLLEKKWNAVRIGGHPREERLVYHISRLLHKAAWISFKWTGLPLFAGAAIARSSFFLRKALKKHSADLYIGHNLGALPAVITAAKKHRKPCGFDAEDFYRNDQSDERDEPEVRIKTNLEDRFIPQLDYLSASSPGIAAAYRNLYPGTEPVTILNVFSFDPRLRPPLKINENKIRLFWFSQTIGSGRGLEQVIKALGQLEPGLFELHLLGNCAPGFDAYLQSLGQALFFHDPLPPGELPRFAAQFDIGLATEANHPYNRDICLTNKIFTYMQAGLAIVASDTSAQKALLDANPAIGKLYRNGQPESLSAILLEYIRHREWLITARQAAYNLAADRYNWEKESRLFLTVIQETIKKIE